VEENVLNRPSEQHSIPPDLHKLRALEANINTSFSAVELVGGVHVSGGLETGFAATAFSSLLHLVSEDVSKSRCLPAFLETGPILYSFTTRSDASCGIGAVR
jgi:hypothetical protein